MDPSDVRKGFTFADRLQRCVFTLANQTPSDVAVIQRPPWRSLKHTLIVVGLPDIVLLGALAWIRALRLRVEERTHQLKAEMEDPKRTSGSLREKTELLQAEIKERKRTETKLEKGASRAG